MNRNAILDDKKPFVGASYGLQNRLCRALWSAAYALLFRHSPRPLHKWRLLLLRAFGARVSMEAYVYPSTIIWAPWNLAMARHATLGPDVNCYNPAPIQLDERAVVSQGSHLCTASHDYNDPAFPLFVKPIQVGPGAWIAAECFVGPGVCVGAGAVLGARTVLFRDAPDFTVWIGNPAACKKTRPLPGVSRQDQGSSGC